MWVCALTVLFSGLGCLLGIWVWLGGFCVCALNALWLSVFSCCIGVCACCLACCLVVMVCYWECLDVIVNSVVVCVWFT